MTTIKGIRTLNEDEENRWYRAAKSGVYSKAGRDLCRDELTQLLFTGDKWSSRSLSGHTYCSPFIEHVATESGARMYQLSEAGEELIKGELK